MIKDIKVKTKKAEADKAKNTKNRVRFSDKKVSLVTVIGWISVLALAGLAFASGWKTSRTYDNWLDTQVKIQRLK